MDKETLAKAKELEEDIRQMETALRYHKNGRWGNWGINDTASTFHFAFHKHYGDGSAYREDLPRWLNEPLMEVVERELNRCKTELDNLGEEKPSAAERITENMKELGKAISSMGVKASDLANYSYADHAIDVPPTPIGYLELEEAMTRLPVFKRIGWFRRLMLRWCFGLKYIKED